jgi:Peptidase family M1 domain/Peptidase M1 N-terminal domain/Immune inhibitor A peptidase M6
MASDVPSEFVRRRRRALTWSAPVALVCAALAVGPGVAGAGSGPGSFSPGAPGAGDPYFPLDGNGGYDVDHYDLRIRYDPATDLLHGEATIRARATQSLSSLNLDLQGLTVHSVEVDWRPASWSRDGTELTVTPRKGLRKHEPFEVEVRYSGVPEALADGSGFIHTDDGTLVVGQPHVAATWYPVNDHPLDKASYTFELSVPAGLEAVANGVLKHRKTKRGWTTWTWDAKEPVASYLTTATIGDFDLRASRRDGIRFWDAIDSDLLGPPASPRTGSRYAISQRGMPAFKRLQRTIAVPSGGATMTFWVTRDAEPNWDFFFVEAHTAGLDDWTTLPDLNGHTSEDTGFACPYWHFLHPFLGHYQAVNDDGTCAPAGDTGPWHAISGWSEGYEQWRVDLSAFAGRTVELSLTYASDDIFQRQGVFVDDIVVSSGVGTTSFEEDGDTMDGWTVPGAPADSVVPNPNDWIVGTADDGPAPLGTEVERVFALQDDVIEFLEPRFGDYPFSASGGIVDDVKGITFALENQTRPIYGDVFFFDPVAAEDILVHELAHQWFGNSVSLAGWQHVWLNEGFATYAEWLYAEEAGRGTAQEAFDFWYGLFSEDDPFWTLPIGDPGPDFLFEFPVYARGAMTLHQLRLAVGDRDFFRILRGWAKTNEDGNVTTDEFVAFAERISGEELSDLFETWLFATSKPEPGSALSKASARMSVAAVGTVGGTLALRYAADGKWRLRGGSR